MATNTLPLPTVDGMLAAQQVAQSGPHPGVPSNPPPTPGVGAPAAQPPSPQAGQPPQADPDAAPAAAVGLSPDDYRESYAKHKELKLAAERLAAEQKKLSDAFKAHNANMQDLQDPAWVQKRAGISTKPTDLLRDALYNTSQLNLRNPVYGSLQGQQYVPIQQQRMQQAMQLYQQRLADAREQDASLHNYANALNQQQTQVVSLAKLAQADQKEQDLVAQKVADRQQKTELGKLVNDYRYAKMAADLKVQGAKAKADEALAALRTDMDANIKQGSNPWQYVMTKLPDDTPMEVRQQLLKALTEAEHPLTGNVSTSTQFVPNPNGPGLVPMQVSKSSQRVYLNDGTPQASLVGGTASKPSGRTATGAAPIGAPPPGPIIDKRQTPTDKEYAAAQSTRGLLDKARDRLAGMYGTVDKFNPDSLKGAWNDIMAWETMHPTSIIDSGTARGMAMARGLSQEQADYISNFAQTREDVNLLRKPLGASGFRGKEGLDLLENMVGNPLDSPLLLKSKWEKLMGQYLSERASNFHTERRFDRGPDIPDQATLDAYALAAGLKRDPRNVKLQNDFKNLIKADGYK